MSPPKNSEIPLRLSQQRIENRARDLLATAMKADPVFAREVRNVFYGAGGKEPPRPNAKWEVFTEYRVATGGGIDLLTTSGNHALALEVKVNDIEKLGQYIGYSRLLRQNYDVCFCGLLKTKNSLSGRRALLEPFLESSADARICWGRLVAELATKAPNATFESLRSDLAALDPLLVVSEKSTANKRPIRTSKRIAEIRSSPESLVAFFNDYVASLGVDFEAEPWHAGNAPISMLVGKPAWATWFGDGFTCRLALSLNLKEAGGMFDFSFFGWNKGMCGGILCAEAVEEAARFFANSGYKLHRNLPAKWHTTIEWQPPFEVRKKGFFFFHVFDQPKFRLPLGAADALGWENSIELLVTNVKRIARLVDEMVKSKPSHR